MTTEETTKKQTISGGGEEDHAIASSSSPTTRLRRRRRRILLGVTGSVAAVKAPELAVRLVEELHAHVKVVISQGGMNFWLQAEIYHAGWWQRLQQHLASDDNNNNNNDNNDNDNDNNEQSSGWIEVIDSADEWRSWKKLGDPVMHIDLRDWADCLVVAPLSAHSLAKFATGLCDDVVSSVVRAWPWRDCHNNNNNKTKPVVLAPAMNTNMWEHPLTQPQLTTIQNFAMSSSSQQEHVSSTTTTAEQQQQQQSSCVFIVPPQVKTLACGQVGNGALASVDDIVAHVQRALEY